MVVRELFLRTSYYGAHIQHGLFYCFGQLQQKNYKQNLPNLKIEGAMLYWNFLKPIGLLFFSLDEFRAESFLL